VISTDKQFDEFISEHRWAVLTTNGKRGPSSSVVAYARAIDELVISTPGPAFKARSIEAQPMVNLCVISNQEPFNFVAVQGEAYVLRDNIEEDTIRVFENITGSGYERPENLPEWLEAQDRVIIRIKPTHVHGVIR